MKEETCGPITYDKRLLTPMTGPPFFTDFWKKRIVSYIYGPLHPYSASLFRGEGPNIASYGVNVRAAAGDGTGVAQRAGKSPHLCNLRDC